MICVSVKTEKKQAILLKFWLVLCTISMHPQTLVAYIFLLYTVTGTVQKFVGFLLLLSFIPLSIKHHIHDIFSEAVWLKKKKKATTSTMTQFCIWPTVSLYHVIDAYQWLYGLNQTKCR